MIRLERHSDEVGRMSQDSEEDSPVVTSKVERLIKTNSDGLRPGGRTPVFGDSTSLEIVGVLIDTASVEDG